MADAAQARSPEDQVQPPRDLSLLFGEIAKALHGVREIRARIEDGEARERHDS